MLREAGEKVICIQVLSDIHAELAAYAVPSPDQVATGADVVVLAGDIARAPDAVTVATRMFPAGPLVIIGGNHEHYCSNITVSDGLFSMRRAANEHEVAEGRAVHALEDEQVVIEVRGIGVRFLASNLWTDFKLFDDPINHQMILERCMNDFRMIRGSDGKSLGASEWLARHSRSREFLRSRLVEAFDGPTVVVTHHLPSLRSVAPRYQHSPLSAGFASNCDEMVGAGATVWIHGHTHDSCLWRAPEGTLVVCNPAGYTQRRGAGKMVRENANFNPKLLLEIRQSGPNGNWHAECGSQRTL